MKATNISNGPFQLESGALEVGESGEFTEKEFKFLSGMGRAEEYVAPVPKPKKKPAKKPAAPDAPEGFL